MNIDVASDNGHKIAASRRVVNKIFQRTGNVVGHEGTDKGFDAQLVGRDKILEGALQRDKNLTKITEKTRSDLSLVIQDGIFSEKIGDEVHWFNMGWVIAKDADGNESITFTTAIEIDAAIVKETDERGFKHTTIGDIIAEHASAEAKTKAEQSGIVIDLDADSTDPQTILTGGILDREEIHEQALTVAIGQLLLKSLKLREFLPQKEA